MTEERLQRRLAAIFAADVVGYSRLMEVDEEGTLARLQRLRRELIEPRIAASNGRTVKLMGDGALVEFPSAVDAIRCAIEIQRKVAELNEGLPPERRVEFRIGIHVGDIIVDGDDIHGAGVNLAARLEGLSEAGGVCVSSDIFRQVRGKIDIDFEDLGAQQVKNLTEPVHAYAVRIQNERPVNTAPPATKPSIAVLAFQNMSGDLEQEYFADGIAEDIITALSRFHWFFVMARNSSFTYKGRNVDVRQVGRELGVRYVLEGSVRKGGDRLRITAQLVDATTGNHLWAEKYDGALEDVFNLQDKITEGVVGAIEPSIRLAEIERAHRKRPDSLDAYDLYLRALPHAWAYTPQETDKAIALLDSALQIDPDFVAAHGLAAWCNTIFATVAPNDSRRSVSLDHARAVLTLHTDDSLSLAFAAFALALFERDYATSLNAIERSLAYTPNSSMVLSLAAQVHAFAGGFDTAIELAEASLRLSPFDPMRFVAELAMAYSYFFTERFDAAVEAAQRCAHINPQFVPALAFVAASCARAGQSQAAAAAATRLLKLNPGFHAGEFVGIGRFAPELNAKYVAALRDAGLPD